MLRRIHVRVRDFSDATLFRHVSGLALCNSALHSGRSLAVAQASFTIRLLRNVKVHAPEQALCPFCALAYCGQQKDSDSASIAKRHRVLLVSIRVSDLCSHNHLVEKLKVCLMNHSRVLLARLSASQRQLTPIQAARVSPSPLSPVVLTPYQIPHCMVVQRSPCS
ncbi:hypothetical protein M011DRAFT_114321 [Sporormia fimetaria CBS 119925]|uniref:Uncharacterized protein n=1 Tax=Sporormia fimetaria CBS 119925 TaxID=1340428 RepID=A0A6A6VNV9_9PLEO|nr:hypothetical protein M011DRAFT_114321 [Sporormia fimetaria CBS 119925]